MAALVATLFTGLRAYAVPPTSGECNSL